MSEEDKEVKCEVKQLQELYDEQNDTLPLSKPLLLRQSNWYFKRNISKFRDDAAREHDLQCYKEQEQEYHAHVPKVCEPYVLPVVRNANRYKSRV